ncbi:hypothetical protein LCGC14_1669240 [marine sediment metagenome]|uniref:DUF1468 domain-containing protein n=1 Tax=marine sediment metagenome TaxID=412755 RepID=A0A0F9KRV0_9ZZZZ
MELHTPRAKRPGEDIFGLIMLVLAMGLFWQSWKIAGFSALSSPGAFPMAASFTMVIAAAIVVIGNARNTAARDGEPILPGRVILFAALITLYALLIQPLGFLPASLLFLFVGMKLLYRGGWIAALVISALSLALIYILFRIVFQVVLPEGIVPEGQWISAIRDMLNGGNT